MRTRRLIAAAVGTLLAATVTTMHAASAVGDLHDDGRWFGQRALKITDGASNPVRLLTASRNKWALLARRTSGPGSSTDTWRLREFYANDEGKFRWREPRSIPAEVSGFRSDRKADRGIVAAWTHDGGLYVVSLGRGAGRDGFTPRRLADEVPGAAAPRIRPDSYGSGFIVDYAGTWHRFVPDTFPPISCNGCTGGEPARWETLTPPAPPAGAPADLSMDGYRAFWTGDTRDPSDRVLRTAPLNIHPDGSTSWGEPQVIATDGQRFVDFFPTYRLVTVGDGGEINLFDVDYPGLVWTNRRQVNRGAISDGSMPQVSVRGGALTMAWRAREDDGGLYAWQEDRPGSRYLEEPTPVPGTEHTTAFTMVTDPEGNLTVVSQLDRHRRATHALRVVHLPTSAQRWTKTVRLASPKPTPFGAFSVGQPQQDGDLRVAVNDDAGVWMHEFDATRSAKMTRPGKTIQRARTYTIGWKADWLRAIDYEVRARVSDKSPWVNVAAPKGAQSKTVTRPWGERRCYQARALVANERPSSWSASRCVTVRR